MLGISLLNEIISKEAYANVSDILNLLRINIISSLKQEMITAKDKPSIIKKSLNKDGMDISMCILNKKTMELQYAGANNPLYIIKAKADHSTLIELKGDLSTESSTLVELKGDKMPISVHERMDSFSMQTISLQKGDCIYLFSDGYADQFGGKMGKKLMYKTFKEMLTEISHHPVNIQRKEVEKYFRHWKGDHSQVDDVLVMGIKIL
jgi:serine phosphatase RsbU (regulator of sigma subunit)